MKTLVLLLGWTLPIIQDNAGNLIQLFGAFAAPGPR